MTLTIEQVCNIGFAVLRNHNDDRLWRALTYDCGPYDLTAPNLALQQLGAAFYAAGLAAGVTPAKRPLVYQATEPDGEPRWGDDAFSDCATAFPHSRPLYEA